MAPPSLKVHKGSTVRIICLYKGESPVKTIWTFEGGELPLRSRIGTTYEYKSLILSNVDESAEGNYSCMATDRMGPDFTANATLKLAGKLYTYIYIYI